MFKKLYQSNITITKPIEDTFNFTSNVNNLSLWSGASQIEVITETDEKIGSIYKVTFTGIIKNTATLIEITEYNSPTLWTFQTQDTPVKLSKYTFEAVDEGTKLSLDYIEEQNSTSILTDIAIKRQMEKLLADLKRCLEKT